ncbi:hypothetical protein AB0B66_25190 [Catellatospora sp. NPDC049111]|uniref:hypothetical protein n=1 Tax=Catellatospora sp. NPDC049111 TaxID=3155271 RepID=UPI0033D55513
MTRRTRALPSSVLAGLRRGPLLPCTYSIPVLITMIAAGDVRTALAAWLQMC